MTDVDPVDEGAEIIDDDSTPDADEGGAPTAVAVLEYLVRNVVDEPDGVRVETDDSRHKLQLNVHVADGDMGRVIGRRGRVANAIRTVVRAAAVRDGVDVDVEFVD